MSDQGKPDKPAQVVHQVDQHPLPPHGPPRPRPRPINPGPVDFGPNVIIFDPSMPTTNIQSKVDAIFHQQDQNQFGAERYALFFKPGSYQLKVPVGYYTTVHGLGYFPDDVTIVGGVQSTAASTNGLALNSFWRGAENLATVPTDAHINLWAVSQATYLRRVHVKGELWLFDFHYEINFSSGGFLADSKIDTQVISGSQQQWLTRNSSVGKWIGGVWNMVFVGDEQAPAPLWPGPPPFTVVEKTPTIREKPYLVIDQNGNYMVQLPALKANSQGTSWAGTPDHVTSLPINECYIARADRDTADSMNAKLDEGFHLILTPGVYNLSNSLVVNHADTIILGLGMATLLPSQGSPALIIGDIDGVSVGGIIFEAGPKKSSSLLVVGQGTSAVDHSANPIVFYDVSCRVGGAAAGLADNCVTVNANDVIFDNVWLWRADHDFTGPVHWKENASQNGLTVNGQRVTVYGLFVEHFQGYQTIWNGNHGSVYFYQSETPYDVPSQDVWRQNGEKGYPSYKVSNNVTTHTAKGVGVYCNFQEAVVQLENAIETPNAPGIQMNNLVTIWLDGRPGSSINHIINGMGAAVKDKDRWVKATR